MHWGRKGNGESEVRKRRRRSGGVLQIIYEKKLWFPGFKQCGKGFEGIYCYTHEHTNFVKLCKKLYRNLTESFFIASSSSISSLPCSSDHFPSSVQTVQLLSSTLTHFPPLSSPFHCCLVLFFLSVFTPNFVVFIISFPLPPSISFCPLPLPPLSPLFSPCFFISPTSSSSSLPILVFFQTSPL